MTDDERFSMWDFTSYMAKQEVRDMPVVAGKQYDVRVYRPYSADPTPEYIAGILERVSYEELRRKRAERDAGFFLWQRGRWKQICYGLTVSAVSCVAFAFWALAQLWNS